MLHYSEKFQESGHADQENHLMELYIMNRRLRCRLQDAGIEVHCTDVGSYCTSMEMAGASITLMVLDEELQRLLELQCETVALRR